MEAKHTPEAIFRIGRHLKRAVLRVVDSTEVVIFPKGSEDLAKEYCDLKNSLAGLTTEQIEELKVWLKAQSTTLMFDYVAKNRLLEAENVKLNSKIEEYKTMESLHKSSSHQIRMLMDENLNLQSENIKLRNCGNCKHEHHPFVESTPCLGCCIGETDGFLNWEGK